MAPVGGSVYFPPLELCLDGNVQLLSWETVFTELSQSALATSRNSVKAFLADDRAIKLLTGFLSPYTPPTPQTRAAFETQTSAIHITPTSGGRYDINQIKQDVLWLSKEAAIDEVTGLRVVILEWQTRPATWLLKGIVAEEQPILYGQSRSNLNSITLLKLRHDANISTVANGESSEAFDSSRMRRLRILEVHLSEQEYLSKTAHFITFEAICNRPSGNNDACFRGSITPYEDSWLVEVGNIFTKAWNLNDDASTVGRYWILDAIAALEKKLSGLGRGSGWLRDDDNSFTIELAWCKVQLVEVIQILQTILVVVVSGRKVTRADVFRSWFQLIYDNGFFEQFDLPHQELIETFAYPLQSLVALVSLAMLKLPLALKMVQEISASTSAAESSDSAPYLLNEAAIDQGNGLFTAAARELSCNASPACLAWVMIMHEARGFAEASKESRELRQSQHAMDSFGVSQQSDNEVNDGSSEPRRPSPHRRLSAGSDTSQQTTYLEDVLTIINRGLGDDDAIASIAKASIDQTRVFDVITNLATNFCSSFGSEHAGKTGVMMRVLLLELVKASLDWLSYQQDIIEATLAILETPRRYWDRLDHDSTSVDVTLVMMFLRDPVLMHNIFEVSLSRFPHETLPFLKICGVLATGRSPNEAELIPLRLKLHRMETFTCVLPETQESRNYKLPDNLDFEHVELTSKLEMFDDSLVNKSQRFIIPNNENFAKGRQTCLSDYFQLPEGTSGRPLSDKKPLIVLWQHEYSALQYLGRTLQRAVQSKSLHATPATGDTREIASDIIQLLTAMISSPSKGNVTQRAHEVARLVLEEASEGIERNEDIISLVYSILEAELHRNHSGSSGDSTNQLLVKCIHFMYALLPVLPGRVWPFLGRSTLLGLHSNESRLAAFVAAFEITSGTYDFLAGCIRLFEALIEDSLTHTLSRKGYQNVSKRFVDTELDFHGTGVTEATMTKIIYGFVSLFIDVFDTCRSWRFVSLEQRLEINIRLCSLFNSILCSCYEVDDELDISKKMNSFLAPAAEYLLDVFFSKASNDLPIQPLFQMFKDGLASQSGMLSARHLRYEAVQTEISLRFGATLLRVNKYLGLSSRRLAEQLLVATPDLAKLYAKQNTYKLPVIELIEAIIRTTGNFDTHAASLLAHMGQGTAKGFLDLLSNLDQPFHDLDLSISIWRLLSAIVSQRQQWFAIYLLTGSTPRDTIRDKDSGMIPRTHHVRSMLKIALDRLSNLDTWIPEEAVSILKFVALAGDYWPWVTGEILKDSTAIGNFMQFLKDMKPYRNNRASDPSDSHPNLIQMASLITDICAIGVHHSIETGDTLFAKTLLPNLEYLLKDAAAIPSYNISLHTNLRKNFEAKFPGCSLMCFKQTSFRHRSLGKDFYYSTTFASNVLRYDPSWNGTDDNGFAKEFVRANINLSLVEAEVNQFHSFKTLVTQMSAALNEDHAFQKRITQVIRTCLQSNLDNTLPQAIFDRLAQARADLAFTLMQRVVEVLPRSEEAQSILKTVWNTLRCHGPDFGLALIGPEAEQIRALLKIMYLALQAHVPDPATRVLESTTIAHHPSRIEAASTTLEILAGVVAQGFRSLTTYLHEDITKVLPADFALINAILRTCLRVPDVDRHPEQLVTQFTDDHTARYACTLLSWSDQLAVDNDPIYGELSMTFLLELSTVPALSESLAVGGILAQISSANIMQYYRRPGGIGPFNEPTSMYNIWVRNILPLALNLLEAVGAPMAAETAAFLAQFRGQIARSAGSFDIKPTPSVTDPAAGRITLSMASEAHSMALIVSILDTFRDAGASAGIVGSDIAHLDWDRNQVKEDLESWVQRKRALQECIVATNEKEEVWSRQRPSLAQGGADNQLEEKVVDEIRAALALLGDVDV